MGSAVCYVIRSSHSVLQVFCVRLCYAYIVCYVSACFTYYRSSSAGCYVTCSIVCYMSGCATEYAMNNTNKIALRREAGVVL